MNGVCLACGAEFPSQDLADECDIRHRVVASLDLLVPMPLLWAVPRPQRPRSALLTWVVSLMARVRGGVR